MTFYFKIVLKLGVRKLLVCINNTDEYILLDITYLTVKNIEAQGKRLPSLIYKLIPRFKTRSKYEETHIFTIQRGYSGEKRLYV